LKEKKKWNGNNTKKLKEIEENWSMFHEIESRQLHSRNNQLRC